MESLSKVNLRLRSIVEWNLKIQNGYFVVKLLWETISDKGTTKEAFRNNIKYVRLNPNLNTKTYRLTSSSKS
jgi:hypothetical protein